MMDSPSSAELLDAVIAFLRERVHLPCDTARAREARIAASLLQTVQRELARPAQEQVDELHRLRSLLATDGGDVDALNRQLCERIADGRIEASNPELEAHLWRITLAKLAVDQPSQSTYQRHRHQH